MRILGLDVGDKRIGAALSDPNGVIASPLLAYTRTNEGKDLEYLAALAKEYGADKIVVGLPLKWDGGESLQTAKTRAFAEKLRSAASVPVEFWDERCTTTEAAEALSKQKKSKRKNNRALIDKVAAAIILQSYLDNVP